MKHITSMVAALLLLIELIIPSSVEAAVIPMGAPGWQPDARAYLFSVPYYHQQHTLTCEIASLRSALKGIGIAVSEDELWKNLPKDSTKRARINGQLIWGDPNKGFVGSPNGSMPRTGYGVLAPALSILANQYAKAETVRVDDPHVIDAALSKGHPIIIWTVIGDHPSVITWKTPNGTTINAPIVEHTRVIVGYRGTGDSIEGVYLIDPLTSIHYVPWSEFQAQTKDFDHVGLEISR